MAYPVDTPEALPPLASAVNDNPAPPVAQDDPLQQIDELLQQMTIMQEHSQKRMNGMKEVFQKQMTTLQEGFLQQIYAGSQ
jgi:hypothetical protein